MPGGSQTGIEIELLGPCSYTFKYVSGAYSTNSQSLPGWLTAVFVFRGTQLPWDGKRLRTEDAYLGLFDFGYFDSADSAASQAEGKTFLAQPRETETYTLVGVDEQPSYADNPGTVTISIETTP